MGRIQLFMFNDLILVPLAFQVMRDVSVLIVAYSNEVSNW